MPPSYPPLANNQSIVMEFAANPVRLVMFGGYLPATAKIPRPFGMPPFAQALNDQEIAAVVIEGPPANAPAGRCRQPVVEITTSGL